MNGLNGFANLADHGNNSDCDKIVAEVWKDTDSQSVSQ